MMGSTVTVPGGKPSFPEKIDNDDLLRPDIKERLDEFKEEESKRKEVEGEFNKQLASHKRVQIEKASKLDASEFSSMVDVGLANDAVEEGKKQDEPAAAVAVKSVPKLNMVSNEETGERVKQRRAKRRAIIIVAERPSDEQ